MTRTYVPLLAVLAKRSYAVGSLCDSVFLDEQLGAQLGGFAPIPSGAIVASGRVRLSGRRRVIEEVP